MFERRCWLPVALLGGVACAISCSGDGSGADGGTPGDGSDPPSQCPEPLEPLEPFGQIEVVGDGTASSCTAESLAAAVEKLREVEGGGTLLFDCGASRTIELDEELFVDFPLLIDGEGGIELSGGGATRVINCDHYTELAVQRLTISGGLADESGGGIQMPWYGSLIAIDVRFEDNRCTSQAGDVGGGAVFAGGLEQAIFSGCEFVANSASNGGGLLNRGSDLTVLSSLFAGNEATSHSDGGQYGNGGGLYIDGMNYDEPGDLFLCKTTFEDNRATQHGSAVFSYFYEGSSSLVKSCLFFGNDFDGSPGGGAGGFYHQAAPLLLSGCTFAENRSDRHAAAVFIGSGSSATVLNCTFADNSVPEVGAALFSGASPVEIESCTFTGNEADYAPAIFKGEGAEISLKNTILADNTTPNQYSALSCHEPLIDGGGNMQWPAEKPSGSEDTPCVPGIEFADPILRELGDYGGPVPTAALDPASPAVGFGTDCPPPGVDARGETREAPCDSGAFELQSED